MTVHAEVIKQEMPKDSVRLLPPTYIILEAEDDDRLFAMFFRDYDNRYKYCNDISHSFTDKAMQDLYRTWISDVNNYANNGGDMW